MLLDPFHRQNLGNHNNLGAYSLFAKGNVLFHVLKSSIEIYTPPNLVKERTPKMINRKTSFVRTNGQPSVNSSKPMNIVNEG